MLEHFIFVQIRASEGESKDIGHFSPVISVKHTCRQLTDTRHLASARARGEWQPGNFSGSTCALRYPPTDPLPGVPLSAPLINHPVMDNLRGRIHLA